MNNNVDYEKEQTLVTVPNPCCCVASLHRHQNSLNEKLERVYFDKNTSNSMAQIMQKITGLESQYL